GGRGSIQLHGDVHQPEADGSRPQRAGHACWRSKPCAFDKPRRLIYEFPMRRVMFKSKIHRATVTQADLDYEGSLTLDRNLLEAADILPGEQVHVWNVTRGTRLQTYAITGEAGSGVVCINGAAAHLVSPGDLVIVATFTDLDEAEAR